MERGFLERMVERRLAAVRETAIDHSEVLYRGFRKQPIDFVAALALPGEVGVVAEVKKASPSQGAIAPDVDVAAQAAAYERGGAAVVSVLTEPEEFGGSFEDLRAVSASVTIPVLCKDFIVHHDQLLLARSHGADAVLLMVSVLGERSSRFVSAAHACGLRVLLEVHDEDEYAIAREAGARVIGVNARNLRDLTIDTEAALALVARAAGDGFCVIAESGIADRAGVEAAASAGASAVLVGTSLMRAANPEEAVRKLTGVPVRAGA